jgi:hypothetical protein
MARWFACTDSLEARDSGTAADSYLDNRAAMRAKFGLSFWKLPGFGFALADRAALRAGNSLQAFRGDRRPANFTQYGGLPIAIIIVAGWPRNESLLLAKRAHHPRRRFNEDRRHQIVRRVRFPPQQANKSQAGGRIRGPTDGSPAAISTFEFEGKHDVILPSSSMSHWGRVVKSAKKGRPGATFHVTPDRF